MKKRLLLLVPFILLMVGCNDHTLTFSGEGDNWKGDYTANISDNGTREDGEYLFGYKNATSTTSFKNLEIVINYYNGQTKWNEDNYQGATISISNSCTGCTASQENQPIDVTIKWDDEKEESFQLEPR